MLKLPSQEIVKSVLRTGLLVSLGLVVLPASSNAQEKKQEILNLTFDDVAFEMEIDSKFDRALLTDEILAMQGKVISLRGYILPNGTKQTGNKGFILVRDNQECCFGPVAALFDCMLVRLKKGHLADYTVLPVEVTGRFQIKEKVIGGRVMAIYRLRSCIVSQ